MMKVLVTGGGGFIGRAIVRRLLERGDRVASLGRSPQPELASWGVEVVQGDIADGETVRRAVKSRDAVINVAAKAGIWGSFEEYWEPNMQGARNVATACMDHGTPLLVHTSTPSVVFNRKPFRGEDETIPYGQGWLCHYPLTKRLAEQEILAYHRPPTFSTIALRPHLVYGPGDHHLVPRLLERARRGRLRIVGGGGNRVDLTYVDNAAHAHLLALDAIAQGKAGGQAYFISDEEPVPLWTWINRLLKETGLPPVRRRIPFRIAYAAGSLLEAFWHTTKRSGEPPMTRFVAHQLAKDHYYSIDAALTELQYEPLVDPQEGFRRTVEWARQWLETQASAASAQS